LSWSGSKY